MGAPLIQPFSGPRAFSYVCSPRPLQFSQQPLGTTHRSPNTTGSTEHRGPEHPTSNHQQPKESPYQARDLQNQNKCAKWFLNSIQKKKRKKEKTLDLIDMEMKGNQDNHVILSPFPAVESDKASLLIIMWAKVASDIKAGSRHRNQRDLVSSNSKKKKNVWHPAHSGSILGTL